ncbi:ABC-three component system middle component 6 [Microbacterium esteraromaticum]|uniref:ABC-three component system middle component 6 n=1 Tax=Microbacterium esteraromaticum TaxID=57043 RepID=UPI001C4F1641|nr:ABC-three component system middle component 6 [Microbacterium esteraromaticum]
MTIGSEILEELREPTSVSALWERYNARQRSAAKSRRITFDWFSLALAALYAMRLVDTSDSGYIRRAHVS